MKVLDLFSGIGGFSLGLERAGFETVAFCEISPKCRHLLNHHWPEVPTYDDVCTLTADRLRSDGIAVDAICGGFPCQDISFAGAGAGIEGERSGLWREYARLIGELRPRFVIVENVSALTSRGLGVVLGDLALRGYDAEWDRIRAADVGAPHLRGRLWIVAYARGEQHEGFGDAFRRALAAELSEAFAVNTGLRAGDDAEALALGPHTDDAGSHRAEVHQLGNAELRDQQDGLAGSLGEDVADPDLPAPERQRQHGGEILPDQTPVRPGRGGPSLGDAHGAGLPLARISGAAGEGDGRVASGPAAYGAGWWSVEPDVGRVAHGVPARVDRLHGLGNAVVPEIPYRLGRAILAAERAAADQSRELKQALGVAAWRFECLSRQFTRDPELSGLAPSFDEAAADARKALADAERADQSRDAGSEEEPWQCDGCPGLNPEDPDGPRCCKLDPPAPVLGEKDEK